MQVEIKLYGGLVCSNRNLNCFGLKKFQLEIPEGSSLSEVHRLLSLSPSNNLVSIVNGHAEFPEYILQPGYNVAVFPPMADRKYDFFEKLNKGGHPSGNQS